MKPEKVHNLNPPVVFTIVLLQANPVLDGAQVIAQVQIPCWLHTRQDALPALCWLPVLTYWLLRWRSLAFLRAACPGCVSAHRGETRNPMCGEARGSGRSGSPEGSLGTLHDFATHLDSGLNLGWTLVS